MVTTMARFFDSICRLCMKVQTDLQPIFTETSNLCSKIKEISPKLQVFEQDGLPAQVCEKCKEKVDISYNFRIQCEESDAVLRHYLSSFPNDQEVPSKSCAIDTINIEEESIELKDIEEESDEFKVEIIDCSLLEEMKSDKSDNNVLECREEVNAERSHQELTETNKPKNKSNSIRNSDYKCESCSEMFTSKQSLEQHQCLTEFTCQICMKVLQSRSALDTHMASHKKEPCRICGKTFKEKNYYLKHMKSHGGIGYECKECSKVFSSTSSLKTHSRIHTGEKPYVCKFCGRSFAHTQAYNYHKIRHTGIKPFQCNICNKTFTVKTTLQHHIFIHTGEKPFVCEVCGYKCRDPSTLAHHRKISHTDYKNILHKCLLCHKEFKNVNSLRIHIRTHTNECRYKCHLCHKAFISKYMLTKHLNTHTVEVYECTWCDEQFPTVSSRDRHAKMHTGQTPYECAVCHNGFSLRRDLLKHVQKWHPT